MRRTASILSSLALTLLATACTSALAGHGSALTPARSSAAPAGPSSNAPSGSAPSAPLPGGQPSDSAAQLTQLTGLLIARPAGGVAGTSAWALNVNPTLEQFAVRQYQPSFVPDIEALLRGEGLTGIAHRLWVAHDGVEADIILMQFATANGAQSRFLFATQAKAAQPGEVPVAISGAGDTVAYYEPTLDQSGNVRAVSYSHRNTIVAEIFTYSPALLNGADLTAWTKAQLARLP